MPDIAIQVLCIGNGAEGGSGKDEANAGNVQPLPHRGEVSMRVLHCIVEGWIY